ncbi:MAG: hypothetical protein ACXVCP_09545 [Bdellovibrio sp.]
MESKKQVDNKIKQTPENFTWITFSDLLTTLFMVFMVVAVWAISKKGENDAKISDYIKTGSKVVKFNKDKKAELERILDSVKNKFALIKDVKACKNITLERNKDNSGFHIYEDSKSEMWFKDGDDKLSEVAKICLQEIGRIWSNAIRENSFASIYLEELLIIGHANSKPWPGITEDQNFLKNLNLSQLRALAAAGYLISYSEGNNDNLNIIKNKKEIPLRTVLTAMGKSYKDPIYFNGVEDYEKSKRLEFRIVLKGPTE